MINVNRLRGIMAECGVTQKMLSRWLALSENTVSKRMQTGVFSTDELEIVCERLGIEQIGDLFSRN